MEIGRYCEMEMKVEVTKVMRMTRRPSPVMIRTDLKQTDSVEYFVYLGSMITNNVRCNVRN